MNIAIDLDGTLVEWAEDHRFLGPWKPGAREALRTLIDAGHKVIVHTCRATWPEGGGYAGVRAFLNQHGFEKVEIWAGMGKPIAHAYIDDRAIPFRGDWGEVERTLDELAR